MPERRGERVVETKTEARAGVTGHNVRYVLAFSLIGIFAAFIVIYFLFFG
jgi:acid phosphatase family membrane protein YuiD